MKYIKKYIKFFETTMVSPEVAKKTLLSDNLTLKHEGEESTELEVVERFSRIYKGLSEDEKSEINSYFK
jgi:hypothetical protein